MFESVLLNKNDLWDVSYVLKGNKTLTVLTLLMNGLYLYAALTCLNVHESQLRLVYTDDSALF